MLHSRFKIPPQVLASTCTTTSRVHVSCSCAGFGTVPNRVQSPTELGLNYVSAGHQEPPPKSSDQVDTKAPPGAHQGGGTLEAP